MSGDTRPVGWIRAARRTYAKFPEPVRDRVNAALTVAAEGGKADIAKPLRGFGSGVLEIALRYRTGAYRVVYATEIAGTLWVLHAFEKKSMKGIRTPKREVDLVRARLARLRRGATAMSEKDIELVHGSGNVFRDFGDPQADLKQAKAVLAARIIVVLDDRGLAVRKAASLTGFAAADFSRIRNADLGRFTLDRLMKMLAALDANARVTVKVDLSRSAPLPQPSQVR